VELRKEDAMKKQVDKADKGRRVSHA
jgi:hypothetical protein